MYEPDKLFTREKLPEFSPAVVAEPWRKTLMDAAEIMRARGLAQGGLCKDVSVCVRGAMLAALYGEPAWPRGGMRDEFLALERHVNVALGLPDQVPGRDSPLVLWNNTPGRTASEVITALEAAARS